MCCSAARPANPADQVIRAFAGVAQRLHQRMTQRWVRRFVHTVEEYVEGTLWEAHNRAHGVTPDLATYLRMRPLAGALFPYFQFADLSEGIALPIDVRKHPAVARLSAMAANVVVWSNDLFSLEKELRHHHMHNLAVVLQRERQLDLQAAIDQAAELHNAEVRSFIELEMQLPSFGPALDQALQRYVGVLRSWMRANLDWSFETGRYQPQQTSALDAIHTTPGLTPVA
jgi:5-epi-alpha-selinene synthase